MKPAHPQTTPQQGFILVASLWLIVFVTIAAAYLAQWAGEVRQQTLNQHQDLQAEIDFHGTLATLLYLLNTRYINEYGVILSTLSEQQRDAIILGLDLGIKNDESQFLKLHDQAYHGLGDTLFSVQDENGLIAVNSEQPTQLHYMLGLFGLPTTARNQAIDRLLDYEDYDSLHRLNGAEARQYREKNRPAPANRLLLTPWELHKVLGWDDYPTLWQNNLPHLTTTYLDVVPNFNVAPKQVLQTAMGITREDAEKLIKARTVTPILGLDHIYQIIGKSLLIDPLSYTSRPSNFMRISLWHPQTGRMREIHLELHTPILEKEAAIQTRRPWTIDYQLDIAKTTDAQNAQPKPLKTPLFNPNGPQTQLTDPASPMATH